MSHVVVFRSVLGLRPEVVALARHLAQADHVVTVPDLYGGRSTSDVNEGFAIRREVGRAAVLARAQAALAQAPGDAVLAGISTGGGLAGEFWAERPAARGILFLCGPDPMPSPRPSSAPIEMHMARPDPFDSEEVVAEWAADPLAEPLVGHRTKRSDRRRAGLGRGGGRALRRTGPGLP